MALSRCGVSWNHRKLNPRRWTATKRQVLERDGFRCTECGKAGRLEVHHVRPLAWGEANQYALSNLQALCKAHHIAAHRRKVTPQEAAWWELVRQQVTN